MLKSIFRTTRVLSCRSVAGARAMSEHSLRHRNNPEVIEKEKESLLREHFKGSIEEPRWHEELASDAEAFVKAERGEIEATGVEITKLEEITKKHLKTAEKGS